MREAYAVVRSQLKCSFDRARKRYDRRVKETNFQVGQFVWYYVPRNKRGRSRKWELHTTGPYRVIQSLSDVNKIIQKSPAARKIIVHVDRLTHFSGETPECWAASDAATDWPAQAPILGHSATGPAISRRYQKKCRW